MGNVSQAIFLDDVACVGNETSLTSCPAVTTHNCQHIEDAGVECLECKPQPISYFLIPTSACIFNFLVPSSRASSIFLIPRLLNLSKDTPSVIGHETIPRRLQWKLTSESGHLVLSHDNTSVSE